MVAIEELMSAVHVSELIFEVTQEVDGGYVAACLTQGDTWDALRANVKDAVEGTFLTALGHDRAICLVREEVLMME
jgi:predicted RNase H-like HicB family nuclease